MEILCTDTELFIFEKIAEAADRLQVPCYLIGGFVRDKIIGRSTKDADIVCLGDGIELAHAVAADFHPKPIVAYFKNFGTAQVKTREWIIEIIGARKESYQRNTRKPLVENGSLEDDQNRRDFTINSMYISLNSHDYGSLTDPFNGLADIQNKIIRTPQEPGITFDDDPLRMLRAVRFATRLGYKIEETTWNAMVSHASRIEIVSQERISEELNGIILTDNPGSGFELLFD